MAEPGSLPSTVEGAMGATPNLAPTTPGTVPFTPGTNMGPGGLPSALGMADVAAATLPAQTPGTMGGASIMAMTPATVSGTAMSGSSVVGSLPTMTPGTAMFGRTPFAGGATPGVALEDSRDATSSYQHYVGVQVRCHLAHASSAQSEPFVCCPCSSCFLRCMHIPMGYVPCLTMLIIHHTHDSCKIA
jgi:hypothetical protein